MSEDTKSPYKTRREMRLAGHGPKPREKMPWWYEGAMADFAQREKDQLAASQRGPLSTNPMVPWGNEKPKRTFEDGEERPGRFRRRSTS